jgi:EAL domain-containing protein (putative c-di-GMP-specific phosphodiesterase class I)
MGIAVCPKDGTDVDTLMRNADTAMYVAKSHGRNNYQLFSAEMNNAVHDWMEISNNLRKALSNSEFELHYQPKASLKSGKLSGMEALIRWHNPQLGMMSPARFIPIAEECGLIGSIGAWVLNEACHQLRQWLDEGLAPVKIAVNLSAAQCQNDDILYQMRTVLDQYAINGNMLELEITEGVVMHDVGTAIRTFSKLRELGVHVAIDDFGTGYSSLSYLKKFPVETLKIDKSFVDDIQSNTADAEIIVAIIAMAHSLGLNVVAEGAEMYEQVEFLHRVNCDEVQGYFYSKPLPPDEMAAFMRAGKKLSLPNVEV